MKQYLKILQREIPKVSEEDLYTPIINTDIDSLDLVVLRVALEKHFNLEVTDILWYQFQTLAEAIEYFHTNRKVIQADFELEKVPIGLVDSIEIRMPQMANSALSENWLLKYLGDIHWQLISKGFNKKSSEFKDDAGNRLYATFVRVNYCVSPLNQFSENETIEFTAGIEGFGNHSFLSSIRANCNQNKINATLMTTFSVRENGDNDKINKCEPKERTNQIGQLSKTPSFLNEYWLLRKGLIDHISTNFGEFSITDEPSFEWEYNINPFYDINGVGLLYFAAYPIIADTCFFEYYPNHRVLTTIYRDIFYFANCNSTDKIIFKLNNIEQNGSQVKSLVSLFRKSDHQMLARILTVKQMIGSF
ncbi:MAG TPA: Pnap_2097 family protein [Prolixibacteraceae bacterium]|jgi:probable biosynthetic protein (TIGR04098 family)